MKPVTMKQQPKTDYKTMMAELQSLLSDMQGEELDVDLAIQKYERGQQLIVELDDYLKTAENKLLEHKLSSDQKLDT